MYFFFSFEKSESGPEKCDLSEPSESFSFSCSVLCGRGLTLPCRLGFPDSCVNWLQERLGVQEAGSTQGISLL